MTSELRSRWTDAGACALITIAIFAIVYYVNGGAAFPTDDAFINLHNAQVLRLGRDQNYEGVPALVGATSGAHLALLLVFEQLVHPDTAALYVLSSLSAVTYVLGVFYMCLNIGCPRLEAALIALGSLVFAGTLFQVLNGMDTGLAMAAVAWDIKLLTDKRRTFWLPALCGVMPFVRPELSLLSAASMLIVFWEKDAANGFKIAAAAVAALTSLPFLLWYWIDTGSLVPNTISAKMFFFAERYLAWSDKSLLMLSAVSQGALMSFPLFLCLRFMRPVAVGRMLALFVAVFLGAYFWRFPSGLVHNGGRYLFVLAPLVLFGTACGLTSAFRKQTLCMVAISILFLPQGFVAQLEDYRTHIVGFQESLADVVRWMNANLPDRPMVMVHDAGYVAYAGHAALVDLVGLKTPAAMDFHKRTTYPSVGLQRSRAVAEIAEAFQPQYLLVLQDWDERFHFVEGLRGVGWTAREVYAGHAPPNTPAALIYHLYELNRPLSGLASPSS
ncbi:hypothetical protein [Bradyrhizobium cytisi]|uniref:Glycosyltransferase RgtA/B/C/D-like domain-containing protein n=1 Tax=Bradyrhizobium cytisi TaxID=515489 RepID=A0A5S4WDY3_9BRAD|nr:hypothetical protein [Bradyrhizobium cytisi]TYL79403.1 hypothetical protein FXB38_27110 [Bradyrhizobium cytisi]